MIEGFNAALSGLRAYANQSNIAANNISNVNTPGYKASRAVTQSLPGMMGVTTSIGQTPTAQGSIVYTGSGMDIGISGGGFIQVKGANGETGYTRAGSLKTDSKGRLTDMNGNAVQGRSATVDSNGAVSWSGSSGDIYVDGGMASPKQTSSFSMGLNLNASAPNGTTFSSTANMYNSLGEAVPVTYSFTKSGPGTWDYSATAPSGLALSGAGANGSLTFDQQGALTSPVSGVPLQISGFPSGAGPMTATWNPAGGGVTSYASASSTNSFTQDGHAGGGISGFSVSGDGVISGMVNGQSQPVARVELSNFANPGGLSRGEGNVYYETSASGQPISGQAGTGSLGEIVPGSLELSNVDLGEQMVNLLQSKNGFAAQIGVIKANDEMLGSLMDIIT
jgi:flagellar hook protein FlgE